MSWGSWEEETLKESLASKQMTRMSPENAIWYFCDRYVPISGHTLMIFNAVEVQRVRKSIEGHAGPELQ